MNVAQNKVLSTLPRQGWLGLLLLGVCWPLNWTLPGMRTAYLFFPLWLGYILLVDALVLKRSGSSLLERSARDFALLFLLSAPAWWVFEIINRRTHNWEYVGGSSLSDFEYYLLCSVSFSTVMPAVFETAELVSTFPAIKRARSGLSVPCSRLLSFGLFISGITMLALAMSWPKLFYPFVWLAVFLIVEPINIWRRKRHLLQDLQFGDWRPVLSLSLGALICGFFWEMWNYFSFPKWIYHTPGAEYLRVFEMPMLGYLGYLPFAWELFALRNFFWPRTQQFRI